MTNIEKLYELAGVEKRFKAYTEDGIVKYFHTLDEIKKSKIYYRPDMYCCDLDDDAKEFPPFTAEKQLEMIKWFDYFSYFPTIGNFHMLCHLNDKQYHKIEIVSFEDTLAKLVCELWEDLTPEQREEVRKVLE